MIQLFKSVAFLVSFQISISKQFFLSKSKKTGKRFFQDFGLIEATFYTRTQLMEMQAYMVARENELQKQKPVETDPTAPKFNLGGVKTNKLS